MDMLKKMNEAVAYIEENLTNTIDYQEIARLAYCSEYHFRKMFSFVAGISIAEYIRRRRLTVAALELRNNNRSIMDIAIKYGYSSADSFTRAFQHLHGITSSEAKNNGQLLKAYPRISFQLSVKGAIEMNYRFEDKENFRIVGIQKRVPIVFEGENTEITDMLKMLNMEDITYLKRLSNIEPMGIIQASTNFSEGRMEEKGELDHYIGVATTHEYTGDFVQLEVSACTWVVFDAIGPFPQTLQETWGRIYAEWFPTASYEQCEGPEIVRHTSTDFSSPTFTSEIWIPVKKII
ncbi:AraC family transcriptional regulator [Lysinibacillus piscis]|uniref:HTH-type transcriptional regulator YdeE n=1 Tax=Lysinibacillus piscis TaxID=2518931 RepID=A0ABQ5NPT8_9BACI|nr:AraC family transcriptional regulator [Lysinibacillus sp. KH24]GLC90369.1 putative HTH-type transcriptional regulator YdeE [Lysinibacillus sp. KH24]